MSCLYYSNDLQKPVPCTIVPNKIKIYDHMFKRYYLIAVEYNEISLASYNITMIQISKYCPNYIDINDLYPRDTQDSIDYFNNRITNIDTNKELERYEKLYFYISNVSEISSDVLYHLCNLFVTDLQFKYFIIEERLFMKSLSDSQFTQSPAIILVPGSMRMLLNLFDKYSGELFNSHTVDNYNNHIQYESLFPISLNVSNIKNNMNLVRNEHPQLFIIH